jgi:cell division protein FtsZ
MSAKIKVLGIGGAGNNVVNRMVGVVNGVEFVAVNTDTQDLAESRADIKLAIGEKTTKGLGSGGDPSIGQRSAEESFETIKDTLKGTDLVFITAGMGGGTGTGAAPIVALAARELGILTVGVVTKPFEFEGKHRMRNAEIGISNLSKFVDCNIVVPNQKLVEKTKGGTTMLEAFAIADDILRQGVQCITDLIVKNMTINIDFADIAAVMRDSGIAHMGIGEASGDNRILKAIQKSFHRGYRGSNYFRSRRSSLASAKETPLSKRISNSSRSLLRPMATPLVSPMATPSSTPSSYLTARASSQFHSVNNIFFYSYKCAHLQNLYQVSRYTYSTSEPCSLKKYNKIFLLRQVFIATLIASAKFIEFKLDFISLSEPDAHTLLTRWRTTAGWSFSELKNYQNKKKYPYTNALSKTCYYHFSEFPNFCFRS